MNLEESLEEQLPTALRENILTHFKGLMDSEEMVVKHASHKFLIHKDESERSRALIAMGAIDAYDEIIRLFS